MSVMTTLYRSVKKLVRRLPVWVFRARPFGVYEISLAKSLGEAAEATKSRRTGGSELDCQIRWVADDAEAAMLRGLASQQCIDDFNVRTRRAAAAWLGGEVIACAWIATQSFDESDLGLRFELQPTEVWLFAAVVESSRRDQGVYGQLLAFLSDDLRRHEVRRILLGVTVGNEPSRRAHARQGASQVGSIIALRSLGFTLCWRHGDVRRLSPISFTWRRPIRLAVNSPAEVGRATVPA